MTGRRGSLGFDLLDTGRRLLRVMGLQVEAVEAVVIRLWIYRSSRLLRRRRRQHRSDRIISASQENERVLLCFCFWQSGLVGLSFLAGVIFISVVYGGDFCIPGACAWDRLFHLLLIFFPFNFGGWFWLCFGGFMNLEMGMAYEYC